MTKKLDFLTGEIVVLLFEEDQVLERAKVMHRINDTWWFDINERERGYQGSKLTLNPEWPKNRLITVMNGKCQ